MATYLEICRITKVMSFYKGHLCVANKENQRTLEAIRVAS